MNLRILIPLALILVGAGLYGLSGSLIKQSSEPVVEVVNNVPMLSVWTSKNNLKKGEHVYQSGFSIDKVPETEVNQQGVSESLQLIFSPGMVASHDINSGQWVSQQDFLTPDQDGYIELVIEDNMVPYAIEVDPDTIVGGVITHGSLVDVIALSSLTQNLANNDTVNEYQTFTISPILMAVKVLKVQKSVVDEETEVSLVLELTRKEIAKLVIAKRIAQLEVHKSIGKEEAEMLHANSGDVLPTYRAIKEFRAGEATVK